MHPKDSNSLVLYRFYQQPKQQPTTETNPTDRNPLQVHGDPKAALDTANENIAFVLSPGSQTLNIGLRGQAVRMGAPFCPAIFNIIMQCSSYDML